MKSSRIFVAGHRGMVGSAIVRRLNMLGYRNVITRTRADLDLTNQSEVAEFFKSESIESVYLAAAKVGGIQANNSYPAEFIYENLAIECNVIHEAYRSGVKKLMFFGSSCIYPKLAAQPMREDALLGGQLEPTNEPYAVAKIAGLKLCESYRRQYGVDFRSVMPTNLYGPGDNYHPENSHVIPALIGRFHSAQIKGASRVEIWGSGRPKREFLHVDDLAAGSVAIMELSREAFDQTLVSGSTHVNLGSGTEISIADLARLIARVVGYTGQIVFNDSKPDGAPRKLLDNSLAGKLGFQSAIPLERGLFMTYQDFLSEIARFDLRGDGVGGRA
jgi:GDP-L-fucose synthase